MINNNYDWKKIGQRIEAERKFLNLSAEALANDIGITRQTLRKWEEGKECSIDIYALIKLANKFNCEVGYLLCEYDCKTKEITDTQKATGLSEQAITKLQRIKESNRSTAYCDILSLIIENGNCEYFLSMIAKRISYYIEKKGLEGMELFQVNDNRIMVLDIDGTRPAVYKDSLIDSILQTEFIKLLPIVSNDYYKRYTLTPEERHKAADEYFRELMLKEFRGEITQCERKKMVDDYLNEGENNGNDK